MSPEIPSSHLVFRPRTQAAFVRSSHRSPHSRRPGATCLLTSMLTFTTASHLVHPKKTSCRPPSDCTTSIPTGILRPKILSGFCARSRRRLPRSRARSARACLRTMRSTTSLSASCATVTWTATTGCRMLSFRRLSGAYLDSCADLPSPSVDPSIATEGHA